MSRKSLAIIAIIAVATIGLGVGAAMAMSSSAPATSPEAPLSQSTPAANDGSVAVEQPPTAAEPAEPNETDDRDDPNDRDIPITGPDLDRARAAALAYTGGGRVTETEVEDEESYYEVEVTLDDGSQIDVQLDRNFNFVGTD